MEVADIKLVYKNGELARHIPGTNTPFILRDYKEDLGVGYNSISLYLLPYENMDFLYDNSIEDELPAFSR